jgi:hypothetical protein
MSTSEIRRFAVDLDSNAALRAAADNAPAPGSHATSWDGITTFASSKGYAFSSDELKKLTTDAGGKLDDTDLDRVTGGGIVPNPALMSIIDMIVSIFKTF